MLTTHVEIGGYGVLMNTECTIGVHGLHSAHRPRVMRYLWPCLKEPTLEVLPRVEVPLYPLNAFMVGVGHHAAGFDTFVPGTGLPATSNSSTSHANLTPAGRGAKVAVTIGVVTTLRSRRAEATGVALAPMAMLLPTMASGINIGVRHVLAVFPLLTICAAAGVVALWRRSRAAVIVLLAWYFVATALAHPDYMSYFNEAALGHPDRIAADSNLDWGQDLLRLADVVKREHIDHLYVAYWGTADWRHFIPQGQQLPPLTPVHGWIAISENERIFLGQTADVEPYAWLRRYKPVRRVGTSIWLYWIP